MFATFAISSIVIDLAKEASYTAENHLAASTLPDKATSVFFFLLVEASANFLALNSFKYKTADLRKVSTYNFFTSSIFTVF